MVFEGVSKHVACNLSGAAGQQLLEAVKSVCTQFELATAGKHLVLLPRASTPPHWEIVSVTLNCCRRSSNNRGQGIGAEVAGHALLHSSSG